MRTSRLLALLLPVLVLAAANPPSAHSQAVPVIPDTLLDFGRVPFTLSAIKDFRVINEGNQMLAVLNVYPEDVGNFTATPYSFTVMPGDTEYVSVTYEPNGLGTDSTTIRVAVYAGAFDTLAVAVRGEGVSASPHIALSTDTLTLIVPLGHDTTGVVDVHNVGGSPLNWTATVPGLPWLGVNPNLGTAYWGAPSHVTISGWSGLMPAGTYYATIQFNSNDTAKPVVDFVVRFQVVSAPLIVVTPSPVDLGTVFVGYGNSKLVTVHNTGGQDLIVTDIEPSRGEYSLSDTAFVVPLGMTRDVTLTVTPTAPGSMNGTLTFYSNAIPPQYAVNVIADGSATSPPVIEVDTDTIQASLLWGEMETRQVYIGNSGTFQLNWQAMLTLYVADASQPGGPTGAKASPWGTLAPLSGSVAAGETDSTALHFDASTIPSGDYYADLTITSNDPVDPVVVIPVHLHAMGFAYIGVSDTVLAYNTRLVGQTEERFLTLANTGIDPLVIDSLIVTDPNFTVGIKPGPLSYGGVHNLIVTFAPQSEGVFVGALVIVSNAINDGSLVVVLQGEGLEVFNMDVSPDSITATVGPSGWSSENISVANGSSLAQPVLVDAFALTAGDAATPPGTPAFYDNFEDLNLNGWTVIATSGTKEIVSGGPASSLFEYRESDAPSGHGNGIFTTLPAVQPRYMSFWVKPAQSDLFSNYVAIRDAASREVIYFFALNNGKFYVNANVGGNQSYSYVPGIWYFVEYRDVDFTAKTFDYYVNDELVQAGISFRNAGLVEDFSRVDLYSFSSGATASWDDIYVAWGDAPAWLTYSPSELSLEQGQSGQIQVRLIGTGLVPGVHEAVVALRTNALLNPLLSIPVVFTVDSLATGIDGDGAPAATALHQNHPNPFNPITAIRYDLRETVRTELVIYGVDGARVRTLVSETKPAGTYEATWDGTNDTGARVSSGVYFYRLRAGAFERTRKMVLLK